MPTAGMEETFGFLMICCYFLATHCLYFPVFKWENNSAHYNTDSDCVSRMLLFCIERLFKGPSINEVLNCYGM